jgi:hypothetical protein
LEIRLQCGSLKVLKEEAKKANKILNEKSEELQVDFEIEDNPLTCPKCDSNNTVTEKYSKSILGLSWLILGFPIGANPNKTCRCFYCGHVWNN